MYTRRAFRHHTRTGPPPPLVRGFFCLRVPVRGWRGSPEDHPTTQAASAKAKDFVPGSSFRTSFGVHDCWCLCASRLGRRCRLSHVSTRRSPCATNSSLSELACAIKSAHNQQKKIINRKRFHCSFSSLKSASPRWLRRQQRIKRAAAEAADGAGPVTNYTPLVNTLPRPSASVKPRVGERDEDGGCKPGESSVE